MFSELPVKESTPEPPIDPAPASVEVTVVEETCLEPEDLRPLEEPAGKIYYFKKCSTAEQEDEQEEQWECKILGEIAKLPL